MMSDLKINQNLWYHANNSSVRSECSLRNSTHQSDLRATIDDTDVARGKSCSQLFSNSFINRIGPIGRSTKDGNIANHTYKDTKGRYSR